MAPIATALQKALPEESWLDGEVVALDEKGVSSFQKLQGLLGERGEQGSLVYFAFDLLVDAGKDLRAMPLKTRFARLAKLGKKLEATKRVFVVPRLEGTGDQAIAVARQARFEGIVSKIETAPYRAGRGPTWVKTKCLGRQELVLCGFTPPAGSRSELGALVLGVKKGGKLVHAGRVGTGFSEKSLTEIAALARKLRRKTCPFDVVPPRSSGVTWLEPELVAEIEYTEWTRDGVLRHPVFKGLRGDKTARDVVDERLPASDVQRP